ncbi:hypothetical protein RFI_06897, partial [Reticulomyxa filosa]
MAHIYKSNLEIVLRLLEHGDDGETDVQNEIFQSLHIVGSDQPLLVLTQSVDYILNKKPSNKVKALILQLLGDVVREKCKSEDKDHLLDDELANKIIDFTISQTIISQVNFVCLLLFNFDYL